MIDHNVSFTYRSFSTVLNEEISVVDNTRFAGPLNRVLFLSTAEQAHYSHAMYRYNRCDLNTRKRGHVYSAESKLGNMSVRKIISRA